MSKFMPPLVLGQLLPAAWRVVAGNVPLPSNSQIVDLLIGHDTEIPEGLRQALTIERGLADYVLINLSDIVAKDRYVKLSLVDSIRQLNEISRLFPTEVGWVKDRIRGFETPKNLPHEYLVNSDAERTL